MAAVLFLYGAGAGLVPWWVTAAVVLLWLGLLLLVVRWFRTRPRATVVAPVLAVALWYAAVLAAARLGG